MQCGVARIYVVPDLVDVIRLRHLPGRSILKMSFRQFRLFFSSRANTAASSAATIVLTSLFSSASDILLLCMGPTLAVNRKPV